MGVAEKESLVPQFQQHCGIESQNYICLEPWVGQRSAAEAGLFRD